MIPSWYGDFSHDASWFIHDMVIYSWCIMIMSWYNAIMYRYSFMICHDECDSHLISRDSDSKYVIFCDSVMMCRDSFTIYCDSFKMYRHSFKICRKCAYWYLFSRLEPYTPTRRCWSCLHCSFCSGSSSPQSSCPGGQTSSGKLGSHFLLIWWTPFVLYIPLLYLNFFLLLVVTLCPSPLLYLHLHN